MSSSKTEMWILIKRTTELREVFLLSSRVRRKRKEKLMCPNKRSQLGGRQGYLRGALRTTTVGTQGQAGGDKRV